jgi:phosphoglycerate dehydrogenase-like enzyme
MDPNDLDLIRAVDPALEVAYTPFMEDDSVRRMRATAPLEVIRSRKQEIPPALYEELAGTEILIALDTPVDLLARAPKLRWIHNIGSGTDHYRGSGVLESEVILTSSKGVAARTIAEFVMGQLLALAKRMPERFELKGRHEWRRLRNFDLYGATLGIVGLGEIGSQVAPLAKAFGMEVLATKRTVPEGPPPPNVDRLYRREDLREMLGRCDAVLIAVAYTPDTRGMIGAAELAAMRRGSYLMDVSRGGVLDEDAFVEALTSGHLAGAALDVFNEEPLPPTSRLWDLPNLIMSSHNAVGLENYGRAVLQSFTQNLRRYLAGEPLRNVVTAEAGY